MSTAKEIESDQRTQRRQIREDAELMEGLLLHPGWKRYLAMIESVGQNFNGQIMAPLSNVLECTKTEFAKGALTGLSLAVQLPSAKMREAKELSKSTDDEE